MPSPETLSIEPLLEPVPGPDPAGLPVAYTEFRAPCKEVQTDHNAADYGPGTPANQEPARKADWSKVIDLATKTVTRESKDLEVAGRLPLALAQVHRFSGLRDGLHLMRLMVDQCWD